ncbi:nuclear cap-binding protein subunit 3-like isoform X3 [Pocillopora damicornis]|uniref:nuclear cap-binding protein subunit 3-like isoform X3 n=1 Tax=Pocillopora damicornis TaxID=46731 RepID=UPI000F54FBA8|nr:nuclear cap-binding protein subunit 3-like isoform X3 [Pocillopora damicornis]
MEFEELRVEIPADDSDKEEKDLPFYFEAQERKERRAKRFGLQAKQKDTEKDDSHSEDDPDTVLPSVDPKELPAITDGETRSDAILIHGVNEMSTEDVFAYFRDFAPGSVEWIDDSSCNVVWDDEFTASRVLMAVGKQLENPTVDEDISDAVEVRWKIGPPHPKAKCLLLRLATKKDKKLPGAAGRSMYYLINGKANDTGQGRRKGIVSSSRKRKLLKEQERVKHMYSGGPEVVFLDKIDTEKEEKMDIDEPPLKIVVNNDGQPERNEPGNLRMRMHADAIEDDDSESDEDDDRREKRDKWKGRIEKKENKMEVRTEKPTLDLRSKLQSRQRHGFNFKNRPSLSIEIKEEPE